MIGHISLQKHNSICQAGHGAVYYSFYAPTHEALSLLKFYIDYLYIITNNQYCLYG